MPESLSPGTQAGPAWQQFFVRYFALLKMLDAAQDGPSPQGEAAPPEHEQEPIHKAKPGAGGVGLALTETDGMGLRTNKRILPRSRLLVKIMETEMKPSINPGSKPGVVGLRRSIPPISHRRTRISDLRGIPTCDEAPLEVLTYERTSSSNMVRKARTHGQGAVRLHGRFIVGLCVTKAAGEWWFEVEAAPFNEITHRREPMDCSPGLLAEVYRAVQSRLAAVTGQRSLCHAGGN